MKEIKIEHIKLMVGNQELILTIEELKDLYYKLGEIVNKSYPIVINHPIVTYPPTTPWITYTSDGTQVTFKSSYEV